MLCVDRQPGQNLGIVGQIAQVGRWVGIELRHPVREKATTLEDDSSVPPLRVGSVLVC